MPLRLSSKDEGFAKNFTDLLNQKRDEDRNVDAVAADILKDVRTRGDVALLDYTRKFDRLDLSEAAKLRVTNAEIKNAVSACDQKTLEALKTAAIRIEDYHRRQLPADQMYQDADGVSLGYRWTAIENAGRPGNLSLLRADERDSGQSRRGIAPCDGCPDARWCYQSNGLGGCRPLQCR